jgi:hypothetical protein
MNQNHLQLLVLLLLLLQMLHHNCQQLAHAL